MPVDKYTLWKCTAHLFHFIPVLDDPILNGTSQSQNPSHMLSLVANVGLSLSSTIHNFLEDKIYKKTGLSKSKTRMTSIPSVRGKLLIPTSYFGIPIIVGKTTFGRSSSANPAFIKPDPVSRTMGVLKSVIFQHVEGKNTVYLSDSSNNRLYIQPGPH